MNDDLIMAAVPRYRACWPMGHGYSARDRSPDACPRPPRWSPETGCLSVLRSVADAPGGSRFVAVRLRRMLRVARAPEQWSLRPAPRRAMVGRTDAPLRDRRTRCRRAPAGRLGRRELEATAGRGEADGHRG